jgi:hypothetical protein
VPYFDPIFDSRPGQSFGDFLGATFRRYYASWHDLAEGTLGWDGGKRWEKMIQIFSEEITLGKVFGGKNAVRCEEFRGTSDDLHVLK